MMLPVLHTALTSKIAVGAAALAMIGGGAALAVEGAPQAPSDFEEPGDLPAPADDDGDDDPDDDGDDDAADAEEQSDAAGAEEVPEAADRAQERVRDIAEFCDETPDTSFCRGPSDAVGDQRSETARNVHRALTGGSDIVPGDPGFGQAVSERARSGAPGDLGHLVSRAARGEPIEDDLDLGPRERPGNGNGRANGRDDVEEPETETDPIEQVDPGDEVGTQEQSDRSEAGPPPHANANPNARANRDR